jgi:anti-sigma regulatory factor (Ser/Thr protein kinase)
MVLAKIVEQAITFLEKTYADTTFLFENKLNENDPPIIIDESQVLNTFTSLLGALAKTVPYIVITSSVSQDYQIAFSPAEWTNKIALQFLHSNNQDNVLEYNLGLLSADRLIRRHRGKLSVEENNLILSLPAGGWEDEPTLRVEIAQAADHYEELREQLSTQEQSDKQPISVAPLITETAVELVHGFSEVVGQAYNLGEAGRRLQLASRFGLLLASNLLVTSAGYQPQPRAVPLEPVLNNLYQLREDRLKHCRVTIRVEPDTPPVLADEIGLMQILVNLVTNALEAMSGTGELSIHAAPHTEGVQLRISDTGSGIPPEKLDRIFDLFYTTKQGQERGVGLHVVTSIVKQFGGRMDVQSTVGEGTTFTIILPAASD